MSLGSEFMRHILSREPEPAFRPLGYHMEVDLDTPGPARARAVVRLEVAGQPQQREAEGPNAVEALERAIRAILAPHYPEVDSFRLADYKVSLVDAGLGQVQIFTRNGTRTWTTESVSADLNRASYQALVQSFEEGLQHASQHHAPSR